MAADAKDPRSSDAILARLMALHPKKIDLTLGRTVDLLDKLGRPQDRLPPVVHVAGTNGKGSLIAFMRAILEAAGYRVHCYTSPHLVRFNERIRLAGELIPETQLSQLLGYCEIVNEGRPITFFEITTAAAFRAFAETPADILLLECGLGGRYDSTNVVDRPALTAITPVSMDHMQFLGETLAEIAGEKAAIQKAGVPSIIGEQPADAAEVIAQYAAAAGAPLHRYGAEWGVSGGSDGLRVRSGATIRQFPAPSLQGAHQLHNAGMAIACLEKLDGFDIGNAAIAEGLTNATWPGRLQRLRQGPLVELLPRGWELWLDGGHNAAAGEVLAAAARDWEDKPLDLIFGMLNTKDLSAFLRPVAPAIRACASVAIPGEEASLSAEEAAQDARALLLRARPSEDVAAAIRNLVNDAERPGRILICGSLYLAGVILAQNA
ncbi:MAG: bifunctional folylpolyglutamate synthase/dihydrofolate synthase [Rhodospirillaceae bacterium]|nr:bifunctional folylpolyglutamate synthase/dihydrofolate synthase [Rhodospirillaceae bacterium]